MTVVELQDLDSVDKKLLNLLQWDFPLDVRPFHILAERVGVSEQNVITRIHGYKSSLVAMQIDENAIDKVAMKISEHRGVSHNYKRDHQFNLWFTLAVPPNASLEDEVARLPKIDGVRKYRLLPTKKLFKIGVKLDMENPDTKNPAPNENIRKKDIERRPISNDDIEKIIELQKDIELVSRPFLNMSKRLAMTEEQVINHVM